MLHDFQLKNRAALAHRIGGHLCQSAPWYRPKRIGRVRGHERIFQTGLRGFRSELSGNQCHLDKGVFFGDRDLVVETELPSGTATHFSMGFLGVAVTGKGFQRHALDFSRLERGQICENSANVDVLALHPQLGVDAFETKRAFAGLKQAA